MITGVDGNLSNDPSAVSLGRFRAVSMLGLPDLGATVNWIRRIGLVLGMAYLFCRLVEFPAHRLARLSGRALANPAVSAR